MTLVQMCPCSVVIGARLALLSNAAAARTFCARVFIAVAFIRVWAWTIGQILNWCGINHSLAKN